MRKRLIIILSAFVLMGGYVAGVVYATDPCQGTTAELQIAKIAPTASPGTYSLVGVKTDASGTNGRRIFVCGYEMTVGGTTPTYQFEQGPGAACSPSPTTITGTYAPTANSYVRGGEAGAKVISTDPGQGLCVVTGGTAPALNGVLQYVVVP